MEFLEREPEDKPKFILPKREYALEDNEKFFSDIEDTYYAQEARKIKEEARSAMDKATLIKTADFNKTLNRWLEENEKRQAIREGIWTPPEPKREVDWNKVGVTATWQISSLSFALLCIIVGIWPICLVSLPLMAGMNLKWLLDREGK